MIQSQPVTLMGLSVERFVTGRLNGALPGASGEVMAGATISQLLSLKLGTEIEISENKTLTVTGIFERGTDEDMALVGTVDTVREVLGVKGYSAVLVNADPTEIEELGNKITKEFSLKPKTVLQIARAEQSLYEKIKLLMLIVMAVVGVCVAGSLSSTMGANILERMEEIGLMKAVGARRLQIDLYFLAEASLAGVAGAVAGFLLGTGLAEVVTKTAFGAFVPLNLFVFVPVLFLSFIVAVISTVLPVRKATGVPASWILRGE
ncbi:MAG: FtsX-like permease family protein [Nitrospirae bacterium]|nr:MAG: FtsX-like permease family protein [Nitrospirota bacterium]